MKDNNNKDEIFQCFETYVMMRSIGKVIEEKFRDARKKCDLKNIDVFILYFIYQMQKHYSDERSLVKMADICEVMKFNKGQVSTALDGLLEKNYLKANVSERDKRITYYKLSDKGKKFSAKIDEAINSVNERINSEVTDEEIQSFKKVFKCYLKCINDFLV